ncbi:hypothetical protein BV22DRAFT_1044696 [Leucogyrophana mollusca]|uniref:Uncharacterized protein n=1 Tax=Leucogyrophana mollusca TaxID=85980 RepID=A0ACB8BQU9_9AGAM|nr:hypothetical protein BV22DRAFT_1044696 [Leucogyrophana mollusca]
MSLVKIPFILSAAWGIHKCFTAPNVTPPADEKVSPNASEEFLCSITVWGTVLVKGISWAGTFAEAAALVSPLLPAPSSGALASMLGIFNRINVHTTITPAFVVGSGLIASAGLLRWLCYRTLGRFFTFQLSVRRGHALVTSGPYSVVRHPSYTGMVMAYIGLGVLHGSRGSWLRTSGILDVFGVKPLVLSTFTLISVIVACLIMRIPGEDKVMRDRFKDEWDSWASQVRYRLIPSIW